MKRTQRIRLVVTILLLLTAAAFPLSQQPNTQTQAPSSSPQSQTIISELMQLETKGRAQKTGYARDQFGDGWQSVAGCDTRNIILARDLRQVRSNDKCQVVAGVLEDPYTGKRINFLRGEQSSSDVQIDHVVALSDAWQKGAQQLSYARRVQFANDPLVLLAVDGAANNQKSDGDAATWLPSNKSFRCDYVSRQIKIKLKYKLWVTNAEGQAMRRVLESC